MLEVLVVNLLVLLQRVDNYEYELPSDFEDEEIDEDAAFTEEDRQQFADWFGDDTAAGALVEAAFADLHCFAVTLASTSHQ